MPAAGINPRIPRMMIRIDPKQEAKDSVYKMYIYDDVSAYGKFDWNTWSYLESETSAEYFRKQLSEIPENAAVELYVNSNGGSVKEGVGIYNQLARHGARKTAYVDGYAYSVASLICMACDKVVMGMGTSMLVHNMWMEVAGNAQELRKAADDLDAMMATNRKIYLRRAAGKISEEELNGLMESEKILTPEECLKYGFADKIMELKDDETTIDDETTDEDDESGDDEGSAEDDGAGSGTDSGNEDDKDGKNPSQMLPLHIMMRQQYITRRASLQEQMAQLDKVTALAKKPEQNKCIEFFNQFM